MDFQTVLPKLVHNHIFITNIRNRTKHTHIEKFSMNTNFLNIRIFSLEIHN